MIFEPVKSSQIHSLSYDNENSLLHVKFHCSCKGGDSNCNKCGGTGEGAVYEYPNVPAQTHEAIRDADSVGSMFHKLIRAHPDKHPHTKL
jgi:hypothetical protein